MGPHTGTDGSVLSPTQWQEPPSQSLRYRFSAGVSARLPYEIICVFVDPLVR